MTKKCLKCEELKDIEQFSFKQKKINKRHCYCKTCFIDLRKSSYDKNKSKYINKSKERTNEILKWFIEIKSKLKCVNCGFSNPVALDFHHVDDNKEYNVSSLIRNGNKNKILKEIEKCVVLCSNCHRIHHYDKIGGWPELK